MAKNLLHKYVWLVETIYKAKRITFEEINKKWLENDLSEGVELALRTFHKWRIAAEDIFGVSIDCERKGGYHYYIANADELKGGNIRNWLLSTISVSNLLIGNNWLIGLIYGYYKLLHNLFLFLKNFILIVLC